jgi:hypothetical protein
VVLLIIAAVTSLAAGEPNIAPAECQGALTYLVEANSGGYYVLIGLAPSLNLLYGNHTMRISVNGTYSPQYPGSYPRSEMGFRGVIYVQTYVINETTFTFAQTAVVISGTLTTTITYTTQISPTTMTGATGVITLSPISVSGLLDYVQEYCVTTPASTTSSSSIEGDLSPAVPGFTPLAVVLGIALGASFIVTRRLRSKDMQVYTSSIACATGE